MTDIARQLPFAGEVEKYVLGAILSGVKEHESCFDILRVEDFFLDPHRRIFAAAIKLRDAGKFPDLLGVNDLLTHRGELEAVGGIAYIAGLSDGLPRIAPVAQWARIVRDKARLREMVKFAAGLTERALSQTEDAAQLFDSASQALSTMAGDVAGDTDDGITYRAAARKLLEEICSGADPQIFTGISHLDKVTGGFKAGELVVITAGTGVGKTALSQQIRTHACLKGRHGLYASGEMLAPHLLRRLLAADAGVSQSRMRRRALLSDADVLNLTNAANHQCDHCRILDGELDVARIRRAASRMKRRTGLDLVVLDYDELIDAPGDNEWDQQANLTRASKRLAIELKCAVILISQLRKQLAGEDAQRPTLQQLYGSSAKAKHASIVIYADRQYVRELDGDETAAELFVLKNRDGKVGRIPCQFNIRKLQFENVGDPDPFQALDFKAQAAGDGDDQ